MFVELIIWILLGILAGIITGLVPGIHVNLISLILITTSPILLKYASPLSLATFIISMSVTHSFLDFIPSIFLGAPEADTALSILPGHKMLLQGDAYKAVKLTAIGSLGSLMICVMLVPILIFVVETIYPMIKSYIGWILIFVMGYMIFKDKKWYWNASVFFLSGILGLIVLNIDNLNEPLFPLLSGLFGVAILVTSIFDKVNIPKQVIETKLNIKKEILGKAIFASTGAGFLTSFMPGMGSAQGAVIATEVVGDIGDHGFMILVGGINTVNFVLSLVTLLVIQRARNGAVIAVSKFIEAITLNDIIVFLAAALIVGGIATILALNITKIFARVIEKVNYQILVISIIGIIVLLTFYFSSFLGLFILIVATFIGMIPGEIGIGRNHCMGCLILPVILFFIL